ncbi:MAG: ABC transporter permease [Ruminiclostridium sp.]
MKLKAILITFKKYSGLIFHLAKNQVSLKYRKSYLGMLWSLLNPLLTMIVLTMIFSTIFKNQIDNFPIYLMCGKLIFDFNSECTNSSLNSIVSNSSLIKKIYIPKYVFPLSSALASLVNMLFSMLALIIVMLFTQTPFRLTMLIFWLPLIYVFLFSTGLGLILASLNVFFRDIKHMYKVFLTLWMYMTPLFYPVEAMNDGIKFIISLNPLYHYVAMLRGMFLYGTLPGLKENLICLITGLAVLLIGLVTMKKTQDKFILHI